MDFNTFDTKHFYKHYLSYLVVVTLLGFPITFGLVEEGYRFIFWIGYFLSFSIQISILQLRLLPRKIPALVESGFPLFTVFLSFFVNLAVLTTILVLEYPFEATSGFLIAYFLNLLFLVFASYFSGK
ncbi:hypothetical protein P3G55_11760 [Leptospira sp. 96542]|nr:hypothetical protein [Leptospira sp. 96542]